MTYDDLARFGIHRHAISAAMRECEALGFIEVTERGRAGNAEFRSPNKFRITYRHMPNGPATDEWQRIQTIEEAEALARSARKLSPKKQNSSAGFCQVSVTKTGTENVNSIVRKPSLQP